MITPSHEGAGYWYRIFSESIFKPQNIYLAESILLPLIAKLIGANKSVFDYQVLCGFITIFILSSFYFTFRKKIHSSIGTLLAIFIVTISYEYLFRFELGFPDPLTIILLSLVVASKNERALIFSFLAALSHFSTALLAISCYLILSFVSRVDDGSSFKTEKLTLVGLFLGKLFLLLWNFIFKYHLNSRIDFVFESGFNFFQNRYSANISLFWQTPGIIFLAINLIIFIYFVLTQKLSIAFSQLFVLFVSYLSLFFTVDGLRVFAVVVIPSYLFLIILFINDLFSATNQSSSLRSSRPASDLGH